MALRIPVVQVHHVGPAVGARPVKLWRFVGRGQPERALPLPFPVELIRVGIGVSRFVAHQAHKPLGRFSFDLEHHPALEFPQPLVHEKERNENRRDADRDEPFVADMTGRVKHQALMRQLGVELLNERVQGRALQLQAELRDSFLQQLVVAQVEPIGGFHPPRVTRAPGW